MISLEAKSEIVRLRGLGYSLDRIVSTVKVSKPTVIKACRAYTTEISVMQSEQVSSTLKSAADSLEIRSRLYRDLIVRLYSELISRDLASVSTDKLVSMIEKVEHSLAAIETHKKPSAFSELSSLSNDELAMIANVGAKALPELA